MSDLKFNEFAYLTPLKILEQISLRAIQIEFHLCQWNLKKANTLKMLWPISHPLEAHLWTIAGTSIRAHGGLLVSGFSCILFLLLSALGFFLCSLWVKDCCTCAYLEGRESQPQETFGRWRVRAMKKYFPPLLSQVENSAVHSTWFLLVPQNTETQFPSWQSVQPHFSFSSLVLLFPTPQKILLEGCLRGSTQVKGAFYWINIGTQSSLYPIKIFLNFF